MSGYKDIRYSDDFDSAFVDVHIPENTDGSSPFSEIVCDFIYEKEKK